MSFQISNFCISQRCQPHLIQNITCHSVLDYQWTNYTLFHTEWTTFLTEGCSTRQGSHGLCYAPSKTAGEAEPSRCFTWHVVPRCPQTFTRGSSGTEPSLQALLPGQLGLWLATPRCLLPWKAKRSLEQEGRARTTRG